ncbi:aspartyl/asparaginyl beta-hydroxylase domain-containing protein [bacterium]|nr:aspartyl/asparaginyl beta-hydroxylase domain-containing protein [bacterium]
MSATEVLEGIRDRRRQLVRRYGKRAFKRLNRYLARQSQVGDRPVFERELFPWARAFEAEWRTIRGELDGILRYRDALPRLYEVSPENTRISADDNWKSFVLYGFGYRSERNCAMCPETARLLATVPRLETAFFSILAPGAYIPPHKGLAKGLLRCHLGLIIPDDREGCRITLDGVSRSWEEGRVLLFDDTYRHEVRNDTEQDRVVLLFDFERPMRLPGRLVSRALLGLMRRSAYVQDSKRQYLEWEERFKERFFPDDDADD